MNLLDKILCYSCKSQHPFDGLNMKYVKCKMFVFNFDRLQNGHLVSNEMVDCELGQQWIEQGRGILGQNLNEHTNGIKYLLRAKLIDVL